MGKRILIDSVYINSGGGKTILFLIIDYILKANLQHKFFFLLDNRLEFTPNLLLNEKNCSRILNSERARRLYYIKNADNFSSFVCMANVPPPINLNYPVYIYFQNDLLINPLNTDLGVTQKLLNFIKKVYINYKSRRAYNWVVQSHIMKKKLIKYYKINDSKINISPIFNTQKFQTNRKEKNTFIYVSSFAKHKNHERLFKAFVESAVIARTKIALHLTIPNTQFNKSIYLIKNKPKNLQIINHGTLDNKELNLLYKKVEFLIFPSLHESFGLPLVESINYQCKVIASDLDYVNAIIQPSILFNPYSVKSIVESIITAINNTNNKQSNIVVENKIDTFVEDIQKHV